MIPIVLLAAGGSSRMRGSDKLLLDVGGKPLLQRQVEMASATGAPLFVALPSGNAERMAIIADHAATPILIANAIDGLSATMRQAVQALPSFDAFMVMLADLVLLETTDLLAVLDARQNAPDALIWRGATKDGKPGHPVLFDGSLRTEFADLTGDNGAASLIHAHEDQLKLVTLPGNRARFDLDTPEDWAAWRDRPIP